MKLSIKLLPRRVRQEILDEFDEKLAAVIYANPEQFRQMAHLWLRRLLGL